MSAGVWSHDKISSANLSLALQELEAFPRTSELGAKLAKQAAFLIKLRDELLGCDWAKAATWRKLCELLETPATKGWMGRVRSRVRSRGRELGVARPCARARSSLCCVPPSS